MHHQALPSWKELLPSCEYSQQTASKCHLLQGLPQLQPTSSDQTRRGIKAQPFWLNVGLSDRQSLTPELQADRQRFCEACITIQLCCLLSPAPCLFLSQVLIPNKHLALQKMSQYLLSKNPTPNSGLV